MNHLGFTDKIKGFSANKNNADFELGRITIVHKDSYIVQTEERVYKAEITGGIRFRALSSFDLPAVGDWVKLIPMDQQHAIIIELFERYTYIARQAVGKHGESQLIAANIDLAFIVMAVPDDFNLNRLDRYITICKSGGIDVKVLLSKTDLISEEACQVFYQEIQGRHANIELIPLSILKEASFESLKKQMQANFTYCFLGSSGVGKSSIINTLKGEDVQKTNTISQANAKGKHTTTHRELLLLPNGSIVIDTPGMRELGITDNTAGLEATFSDISHLAKACKYADCSHTQEDHCAVLDALEQGELTMKTYQNYLKLKKEQDFFSRSVLDKKKADKQLGKLIRNVKKQKRHKF